VLSAAKEVIENIAQQFKEENPYDDVVNQLIEYEVELWEETTAFEKEMVKQLKELTEMAKHEIRQIAGQRQQVVKKIVEGREKIQKSISNFEGGAPLFQRSLKCSEENSWRTFDEKVLYNAK
jgi:hypothetical protein